MLPATPVNMLLARTGFGLEWTQIWCIVDYPAFKKDRQAPAMEQAEVRVTL
jgi:hypothetical protein